MGNVYTLGAVKPWVQDAAYEIGNKYGVRTIYGVGARDGVSDHPSGHALDFMTSSYTQGDQIAAFTQQNAGRLNVQYIIWKQHIWNIGRASEGWRAMPDRGSVTANHYDHVHVSFKYTKPGSTIKIPIPGGNVEVDKSSIDPLAGVKDSLANIKAVADFLSDSHNWLRIGMFVFGLMLILAASIQLGIGVGVKPASVKKVVKNVGSIRSSNA